MARTEYILISGANEELFYRSLRSGDRLVFSSIRKKTAILSRKKKLGLSQRSLLPQVSDAWNLFSSAEKTAWSNAGAECGLNGWRLFVKDKCLRIVNDIAGVATPSLLHQALVGNIKIVSPATEIQIVQLHPHSYWISQKVYGKKGMYQPVVITEDLALPLKINLNYSSNLFSVGPSSYARLYAQVWSSYQGVDHETYLQIDLDFVTDWKNVEATLSSVIGHLIGYDLYFVLHDLQGDLYFDNIKSEHSGQNWVRDTYCNDINQGFTRAFYQIPKHWVALVLPSGAEYGSIYKDF